VGPRSPVIGGPEAITIPQLLSYQGRLTDTLGVPVADGEYPMMFLLYTVPSGGSSFWSENQSVTTRSGLFSVLLGSVTPIDSMPSAGTVYLAMTVSGGPQLTPRVRIGSAAYSYLSERATDADLLQGKDTTGFVKTGQANSVTSLMITDATIAAADLSQMGASSGQVMKWTGSAWTARNDSLGPTDSAWVRVGSDSVLYTIRRLGIARGSSSNRLWGDSTSSHVNLGVACTTGTSGQGYGYATVGGGQGNLANSWYSTAAGGRDNKVSAYAAAVGGGRANAASGQYATVGGGQYNTVSGNSAVVGGGRSNQVAGQYGTVAGGYSNSATEEGVTVGGGQNNLVNKTYATVGGGYYNYATGSFATVGGGQYNVASDSFATVAGGYADTSASKWSFTTGKNSVVPETYTNSAAFNGQTATAASQTRVGALSKASGTFTIDHPLDPHGKILNHYFIEGPEMRNIYEGEVTLDVSGRAVVQLPAYFDALNRKPRIQVTGVGTNEVIYVAEKVSGNRFVIGGPAGAEVYWQVTGERKDVSAEATRRMMPVEQPKTGPLAGRMLDDEFISGCLIQLEREGKADGITLRTPGGRARHEKMKQHLREAETK
ncbi:hypothetical protein JXD38_03640, partial [candidate division WOR-3 bacterium]|nr:hypothetical protein [candidate division WOR-3 bacterium]